MRVRNDAARILFHHVPQFSDYLALHWALNDRF